MSLLMQFTLIGFAREKKTMRFSLSVYLSYSQHNPPVMGHIKSREIHLSVSRKLTRLVETVTYPNLYSSTI
jgi:hypothetical protein